LISFSGLTFYGGLIVGAISVIWYTNKHKIKPFVIADAAAPGLMLAYAVGRIGCQLAGDGDWGIVNNSAKPGWLSFLPDWMWSFTYPHNVNRAGIPIPGCEGTHCYELADPVWPTPFYETMMCLTLFGVLWYFRKRIKIPGILFSLYLILNGIERFFIEKIRVNSDYIIAGFEITQAEIISTGLILAGVIGMVVLSKRNKKLSSS
ncbi:MAG: diacylglyceryl transferase, partial [Bacteroidia bacterium]|nr:diacylglyceryl transferase [Bacteroidia bacterium]NNM15985.1 diacylglyceryl transferase [Bacteroidia bacterium]